MTRYHRDRRVRRDGTGYTVTADGTEYRVMPTEVFGWCIFTGPNLNLAHEGRGNLAHGYSDADAAIRALLRRR